MLSAPALPASLSEACGQRGHRPGTPRGPPTPVYRTSKPRGSATQLPRTTERETTARHVHIAVRNSSPSHLTRCCAVNCAGWPPWGEKGVQPRATLTWFLWPPHPNWYNFGGGNRRQGAPGLGVQKATRTVGRGNLAPPTTAPWRPPPSHWAGSRWRAARLLVLGSPLCIYHQ